ncbi:hypothetical protein AWR27_21565 [Spirosoma montaniterrae]|uniref:Uncharacterized protein n=2 Tax=Spirosoma montaniterrae TaxID=1178516 RepID=A0A1P9X4R1_9BACT|nr:hypothetical protein AWR27_21565 [Spirosoma montaniterrae]
MNARNLFSFVAFVSLLFGLGLVFTIKQMADLYLTNPGWVNPGTTFVAQSWGALLIAVGVGCWAVRNDGLTTGSRAMLLMLVVTNVGWIVLHTLAIVNGVETPMAWFQVVMSVVVAGWSAMLLRRPVGAMA